MKKNPKTMCLLCITRAQGGSASSNDHFCNGTKSKFRGNPVTKQTSCSSKAFLDIKLPLRGKLAILFMGLANWLAGTYDE